MNLTADYAGLAPARIGSSRSLASKGPIVIVDDNASDALWADEVIGELEPKVSVQILTSGGDLVAYFQGEDLYRDRVKYPYPGLVLLDLKMPKMDGFEVLEWRKIHVEHAEVPIVVLSSRLDMPGQVTRAYQLGADSFLPKPIQKEDIQGILPLLRILI